MHLKSFKSRLVPDVFGIPNAHRSVRGTSVKLVIDNGQAVDSALVALVEPFQSC